jgi:cbb3-type cytochrome oxidase subunit 3
MNPVFRAAAETARLGWMMGVLTAVFLTFFLGWAWWAYSSRNKQFMEQAGRMPLTDGDDT